MPYTVKAFLRDQTKIEEQKETYNEAHQRATELEGQEDCYAAYIYGPENNQMWHYDEAYEQYLEEQVENQPACVYCGSTCLDGYCWLSPDGTHCEDSYG